MQELFFEITPSKAGANVWVTWVVRNIGEGVLGHAHLGKGVVEVALGITIVMAVFNYMMSKVLRKL